MDIQEHANKFKEIVQKYKLEEKAGEIADHLTKSKEHISAKEFATLHNMTEEEATTFLTFIERGIQWKEEGTGL